jgi:metal-dependent HD superfamily phosphatase/phosphodiesterase
MAEFSHHVCEIFQDIVTHFESLMRWVVCVCKVVLTIWLHAIPSSVHRRALHITHDDVGRTNRVFKRVIPCVYFKNWHLRVLAYLLHGVDVTTKIESVALHPRLLGTMGWNPDNVEPMLRTAMMIQWLLLPSGRAITLQSAEENSVSFVTSYLTDEGTSLHRD